MIAINLMVVETKITQKFAVLSPPVMGKQVGCEAESFALPEGTRGCGSATDLCRRAALAHSHLCAGAGIKAQVCSLMELLTTTLYQAHALFYTVPEGMAPDPALPCGLLFSTLESTTGQNPAGEP